jgi:DNA primase catalytic core
MSNITDWIKYELYPSLFECIDRAFPEHKFKRTSQGWTSKTYLDGRAHKRTDKTVVTKQAPGYILEQGGEVKSLVDYVIDRDGVDFITAIRTLSDIAGLQIPKGDFNTGDYQKQRDRALILEDLNSYFIYCLENSSRAKEVKGYLVSRGYSEEDIKAMELGYIPSQEQVYKYLEGKRYEQTDIKEAVSIDKDTRIGDSHRLTIPYRSGGYIKGFKFRAIGQDSPKYLNSSGLDRKGGFFNLAGLKGDKDLVIVEGELDSLHATAKGIDNVVATGGSSINPEQIKDAIKRGAKSFTICLDREPGKEEQTDKSINRAIEVILDEEVNRVYTVILPDLGDGKTDPDRLIKEKGADYLREAIRGALSYYEYSLQSIIDKYGRIQKEKGELKTRDIDNLLGEIMTTATNIKDPIDRDRFKELFVSLESIKGLGITQESLSITVDRLTSTRERQEQEKGLKDLLHNAKEYLDKGETQKALELLESQSKEVKIKDKATEFNQLLVPVREEEIKGRQATKPESLNSGYKIDSEELLLPSGALSIFTGPTSHGKTTFLINLALNIAESYQDREVYLFSYEEDGDSIIMNTLNTYLDTDISTNNRRFLRSYFSTGSLDYIKEANRDKFTERKDRFFKEILGQGGLTINYSSYNSDTLIEAIRHLKKHATPGAILIDYIQLLNLPQGKYKTYSRQEEIKEICIGLKDIAVETGLPIILGAQFNREVTNQLKLQATKIGEAGDIERIANLIVGFWNNNFTGTGTDGELEEINKKGINSPNTLYTTILKNRDGKVGLSELLSWDGNKGKIENNSTDKPNPF